MDLDCGIRVWYKKPTFYLKIAWGLMSIAALVYAAVLWAMTTDKFFYVVITTTAGTLSCVITILISLAVIGNVLYYVGVLPNFKSVILYTSCGLTGLAMIIGIVYSCIFGSVARENEYWSKYLTYITLHSSEAPAVYLRDHLNLNSYATAAEATKAVRDYFDDRCTGAASSLLGIMIPWFILQCVILFDLLQEDEYESLNGH